MNNILLAVIAACVLVTAFFLVPMLVELKRTLVSLRKAVDENLNPALDELRGALKSIHGITDDVSGITSEARVFSKSVGDIGRMVGVVNGIVESLGSSVSVKAFSLKAGVGAAVGYFLKNLLKKGD